MISIPQNSATTSVQQQSIQITDQDISTMEQSQLISSSQNSLDEALNNVEQWSDIIIDSETPQLSSPSRILHISHLLSKTNEYVDEQYVNHQFNVNSNDSDRHVNSIMQPSVIVDQLISCENVVNVDQIHSVTNDVFDDEVEPNELHNQSRFIRTDKQTEASLVKSLAEHQEEKNLFVSTNLSDSMDQVIETIHVEDELYEAKETLVTGIQAPNDEKILLNNGEVHLLLNQLDNDSSIKSTVVNLRGPLSTDGIERDSPISIIHKIVDHIDVSHSNTCADDQKSEAIIITTEASSSISFPISNVHIESMNATSGMLVSLKVIITFI
jgi:hypothetical protein